MVKSAEKQVATIVVGYDGSESSEDALSLAKVQAELTGARLIAVFAYRSDLVTAGAAEHLLRGALRDLSYGQPAAVRAVADRPAAAVLTHTAEREHADLLVVGAGRPPLIHELRRTCPCRLAVAPRGFADERRQPLILESLEARREVA